MNSSSPPAHLQLTSSSPPAHLQGAWQGYERCSILTLRYWQALSGWHQGVETTQRSSPYLVNGCPLPCPKLGYSIARHACLTESLAISQSLHISPHWRLGLPLKGSSSGEPQSRTLRCGGNGKVRSATRLPSTSRMTRRLVKGSSSDSLMGVAMSSTAPISSPRRRTTIS